MKENQSYHQDNLSHLTGFYHGRYYNDGVGQISLEDRLRIEQRQLPTLQEYIVYQGPPGQVERMIKPIQKY